MGRLPDEVRTATEAILGPLQSVEDRSWPHGVTSVWRVVAGSGRDSVWVKQHTQLRKFWQETTAYANLVPALQAAGQRVPTLLASRHDLLMLVISHVEGDPVEVGSLDLHRQAGEAAAAIHAVPWPDDDPVPVGDALMMRFERWVQEVGTAVSAAMIERVAEAFADRSVFDGCRRCLCHRDWSPRNWLVDSHGRLGLLDFEHSGPDYWLFDLVKLADDVWRRVPGASASFFAGYGRSLTAADSDRLLRLMWLHALGTVGWATSHGDPAYARQGHALLEDLSSGWRPDQA